MTIVKLIDSSNEKIFSKYKNFSGPLVFVAGCIWILDKERMKHGLDKGGFHTSAIVGYVKLSESVIMFETLNSEYTFEILEGKFDLEDGFVDVIIEANEMMHKEE
jgi:hypothetical protein